MSIANRAAALLWRIIDVLLSSETVVLDDPLLDRRVVIIGRGEDAVVCVDRGDSRVVLEWPEGVN